MSKRSLLVRPFDCIVSLPENRAEWAVLAEEAGATGVKVHLNCHHPASGTQFGTFQAERSQIKAILESVSIPVGIMPGHGTIADKEELLLCAEMGISFVDLYREDAPQWIYELPMTKMIALSCSQYAENLQWAQEDFGDILEASFVPSSAYGTELRSEDIEALSSLVEGVAQPVFLPTQKKILPEQLQDLQRIGLRGIILGTVVLGAEKSAFGKAIRCYTGLLR